jgi:HD-like signal output (HDOD) protein
MSLTDQIAIAALRRFDRLAELDEQQLSRLAAQAELRQALRGTCLIELGALDTRQLFLVEGELELEAGDGAVHRVRDTDPAAQGPVSRLRPSRYRVTACTDVRYLLVDDQLLEEHSHARAAATPAFGDSYLVSEPKGLLDDTASHPVMFDVFYDLNHGRIVVPSDHDVAIRVGRALNPFETDLGRLARTLAVCPALTLKMVRAARSAARGAPAVRSARAAVERLGAEEVFALSVNCVLRESLRTESDRLRERMRSWWETTMGVAAIAAEMARMSERFDPAYANLIGLLSTIAEPVLLGYADRHADLQDATALERVVHGNRAELGRIMLTMWDLPHEVVAGASHCNRWGYQHAGDTDYTDILLAAQWYALQAGAPQRRMPPAAEVPALRRLGMDRPTQEVHSRIIAARDRALDDIEALLST